MRCPNSCPDEACPSSKVRCPNGCLDGSCPVEKKFSSSWREVTRLEGGVPSRSQYLAFALKKEPFLIPEGAAEAFGWNLADGRWRKGDYFLNHPQVVARQDEADAAVAAYVDFGRVRAFQTSAREALRVLLQRNEQAKSKGVSGLKRERLYLTAWEYDPPSLEGGGESGQQQLQQQQQQREESARPQPEGEVTNISSTTETSQNKSIAADLSEGGITTPSTSPKESHAADSNEGGTPTTPAKAPSTSSLAADLNEGKVPSDLNGGTTPTSPNGPLAADLNEGGTTPLTSPLTSPLTLPLAADLNEGKIPFMRCLLEESESEGLRSLSKLLRWLYVSEPGTACATHIDPMATQAWMYLTAGRKEWRFVRMPQKSTSATSAVDALSDAYRLDAPDLFDCRTVAASEYPQGSSFFHVRLEEGGFLFIPSLVFHAVRNTGDDLTIAVSHNSLDIACWTPALEALSQALLLLEEHENNGEGRPHDCTLTARERSLEALSDQLDAPLFGLLSVCLMDPWALFGAVLEAGEEASSLGLDPALEGQIWEGWHRCLAVLKRLGVDVAEAEGTSHCCSNPTLSSVNSERGDTQAAAKDDDDCGGDHEAKANFDGDGSNNAKAKSIGEGCRDADLAEFGQSPLRGDGGNEEGQSSSLLTLMRGSLQRSSVSVQEASCHSDLVDAGRQLESGTSDRVGKVRSNQEKNTL
eukprot:CAMPEP_0206616926 /NCGR_PEP_ID=MMETSP0325_2-20121206/59291_1 /ASSEMBLY_ACC=CAM_ASM_000347 /TAXON_ID=2866 /ORGANISM="Crypthecodinium cohnii, Strain Seligo" /LENGTH=696 /DNA_ID=CAMNT_0054138733 /DNA_START=317 /DNA_END=2404 /DNA_ORIENTATION=-